MKMRKMITAVLAAALSVLCLMAIAGCDAQEQKADAAAQNRAYMSQANSAMMQLDADLEPFTAAVAAEDVVTMEQAASKVYRDIDTFKAITAPDAMKDIHAEYSAGCEDLKQALQAYIALYSDASNADAKELNEGLASVQALYDSGIAHLKAGDTKATQLTGALPEGSSSASSAAPESASAPASSSSSSAA